MIGKSAAFLRMQDLTRRIAAYIAPVLIEGETGTGKELVARAIHYEGERSREPFVAVNCGALPETLIESELFGHTRGAFTDAVSDQPGLVELAKGGTLFLDEIDALSPKGQVMLLRFLQDQQFRPLGSRQQRTADVRLIAASNRSLEALVAKGGFRQDLLYRLRIFYLPVPPLRERPGDAALLAEHFVRLGSQRFGKPPKPVHRDSLDWFDRYAWPGNIRELENLIYQAFLLSDEHAISVPRPAGLDAGRCDVGASRSYRHAKATAIEQFEQRFLAHAMRDAKGSVSAAARLIGTERRHLGKLLKKYGIDRHDGVAA